MFNKIYAVVIVTAIAFLAMIYGSFATRFEIFPYPWLKNALVAAEAALELQAKREESSWQIGARPPIPEDAASPAVRDEEPGLSRFDPERAYPGYTIYTALRIKFPLRLIDLEGNSVHEWRLPLDELPKDRLDGQDLDPDNISLAYPRLLPNGDVLAVLGMAFETPWGLGIMKIDKDSNLLWAYTRQTHHNLDVDADGNIYAMTHTVIKSPWPGLEQIQTPFLDDQIAVLNADGEEQKVVSVLEAIQGSPYESLLVYARVDVDRGDLLHLNSVQWLDAEKAALFPNAEEGDVLISLRQLDVIAVMDLDEPTIKWALRGPWHLQHDPEVLANGNMLLFDNRGDLKNAGGTRIMEFDPQTLEVSWEYPDNPGERLYSSIYGSQQ
ncbi:MAG: arylsulfotransferase family protein, partial [Gammaproteobacteria bacterium]